MRIMKTLALLSIWLALPLAAQNAKIEQPEDKAKSDFCEHVSGGCPEKATPPTPDEVIEMELAVIKEQAARINWLQKLMANQAGMGDSQQADQAMAERVKLVDSIAKKHGACDGAQLNFASKQWVCQQK